MTKTAWVFPGQGSQAKGMGVEFINLSSASDKLKQAEDKLKQAEEILGWSVLDICQNHEEKLSQTFYTQPCLYVIESILADFLLEQGYTPNILAGHSLGEYVALYTARVFSFEAGTALG